MKERIKFKLERISKKIPSKKLTKKIALLGKLIVRKKIHSNSMEGNLSLRKNNEFIITATKTNKAKLKEKDFVLIHAINLKEKKVFFSGLKKPSSETIMHYLIYKNKRKAKIIIHFHNEKLMKKLKVRETRKFYSYGSIALAKEVAKRIKGNILLIKKHGFILLGQNINELKKNLKKIEEKL